MSVLYAILIVPFAWCLYKLLSRKKQPDFFGDPTQRPKKRWYIIGAVVSFPLVLIALPLMTLSFRKPLTPAEQAAADARDRVEQKKQQEEEAKAGVEKLLQERRVALTYEAKKIVRELARNPESVSFSYVGVDEYSNLICMKYRAQNGFGGMNLEYTAVFRGKVVDWNKHCAKAELYEQSKS